MTVLSVSLRAVVEAAVRAGVDRERLLAASGIRAEVLDDPDARVPLPQSSALWEQAERLAQVPDFALRAGESLPMGAYRATDYLLAYSATAGEGLRRLARWFV